MTSSLISTCGNTVAYPQNWLVKARTEEAAYQSSQTVRVKNENLYVGFPWASLFESMRSGTSGIDIMLVMLDEIRMCLPADSRRVVTTSEHELTSNHVDLFKKVGITDVLWPHKTHDVSEIDGLHFWPFPMYPLQTPLYSSREVRVKKYLANFFGAYRSDTHMSDTRKFIFALRGHADDLRIVQRPSLHFESAVQRQLWGDEADDSILDHEDGFKKQYLDAIRNSHFTLCPTGTGPNTTRIFESLSLGAIPVILTNQLDLPGNSELWEKACVFVKDSEAGLSEALFRIRSMSKEQMDQMRIAGNLLYRQVGPRGYDTLIKTVLNQDQN